MKSTKSLLVLLLLSLSCFAFSACVVDSDTHRNSIDQDLVKTVQALHPQDAAGSWLCSTLSDGVYWDAEVELYSNDKARVWLFYWNNEGGSWHWTWKYITDDSPQAFTDPDGDVHGTANLLVPGPAYFTPYTKWNFGAFLHEGFHGPGLNLVINNQFNQYSPVLSCLFDRW